MMRGPDPPARVDTEFAPAKVNLYLHVTGRRADGYHLLDSLVVFAGVGDRLRAAPSPAGPAAGLVLRVEGPFASELGKDNLVVRAARALAAQAGCAAQARLVLDKRLPVASGIGGGSADAAAALRLLSRQWGLSLPGLAALALTLGADVPACLGARPARMTGVGETLSPVPPLPPLGLLLVNPGVGVSTQAVFRARAAQGGPQSGMAAPAPAWTDARALAAWLGTVGNDLEAAALSLCPAIGAVLAMMRARPGCLLARMSGSGATCFALFEWPEMAAAAAVDVRPSWWAWGGGLASEPV